MSEFKRILPNLLTLSRIPLAFASCYFAFTLKPVSLSISLTLFILASITDYLDGHLARKWNIITTFGKILDPISDKLLILGVFVAFTYHGLIPIVMTVLIAGREILLTVIRLMLLPKKIVLSARGSGKLKTVSQISVLITIYVLLIFRPELLQFISADWLKFFIYLLCTWVLAITLYSGYEFWSNNRKAIDTII